MTFDFIFSREQYRIIPAVLIDNRANIPAIANQIGTVIKAYTDSQVALVTPTTLFYKVESNLGSICGYFTLNVNVGTKAVALGQFVLRPNFQQFLTQITNQISTFIQSNMWQNDYLFTS
jgi:hypothetical protein